jgi:hypothetical protein
MFGALADGKPLLAKGIAGQQYHQTADQQNRRFVVGFHFHPPFSVKKPPLYLPGLANRVSFITMGV